MDSLDRQILQVIQRDFPVTSRPYAALAKRLGSDEHTVLRRVRRMRRRGLIRRIGGHFDSRRLGFTATLVAMELAPERLEEMAATLNRYPNVTHNYERDDTLNLWFTVIAPSKAALRRLLRAIREETAPKRMVVLDAKRVFKIDVRVDMARSGEQENLCAHV